MTIHGHNSRAFDNWYSPEDEIDAPSTLELITSGLLVSDDARDIQLWRSLRGIEIPMSLESSEWGDVER
jgi:hypothetical protein